MDFAGTEIADDAAMNNLRLCGLRVLLTALPLVWAGSVQAQQNPKCVEYRPATVKLTGVIISRTYPGPPEYENIRKGDEPQTYWLLALSRPICVAQKSDDDPAEKNIRRIQLVFSSEKAYRTYRRLLGKRVVATGTLYPGSNIHHKTPVLLTVSTLEREKASPHR